jgi:hypothetical protein
MKARAVASDPEAAASMLAVSALIDLTAIVQVHKQSQIDDLRPWIYAVTG